MRKFCLLGFAFLLMVHGLTAGIFEKDKFLPADKAFVFQAESQGKELVAKWQIAPGYYLYKEHFAFSVEPKDAFKLGKPEFPTPIQDPVVGKEKVYGGELTIRVPVLEAGRSHLTWIVNYQGCAKEGLCYPPVEKKIDLQLTHSLVKSTGKERAPKAVELLFSKEIILTLLAFLAVGLGLVFTPCVLPMIPILSSIIIDNKKTSTTKAFLLSLTYVLAMSFTFTTAGVIAGAIGFSLQAALQSPWILGFLSVVFLILSASMLGLFELRMPAFHFMPAQKGRFVRAALLGAVSSLIVSPCITPVLAGALLYIGQSGDVWMGGAVLLMMSLGMGIPLLLIGTFEGALLPKAGPWMKWVKIVFGLLLLAVAIGLMGRLVPSSQDSSVVHTVYTQQELDKNVSVAEKHHRPVMVKFYADWCSSCKSMENGLFKEPKVVAALKDCEVVKVDITKFDHDSQRLMANLNVFAPPAFLFYDAKGKELENLRLYGLVEQDALIKHLQYLAN